MERLSRFGFSTSKGPTHGITVWLESLEHEGLVTHAPGVKATKSTSGRFPRVLSWASPGHRDQLLTTVMPTKVEQEGRL
jgi:hypothetical protein